MEDKNAKDKNKHKQDKDWDQECNWAPALSLAEGHNNANLLLFDSFCESVELPRG